MTNQAAAPCSDLPFLTWTELQEVNVLQYQHCKSKEERLVLIQEWLDLDSASPKTPIVTSLFLHAFQWAEKQSYATAQLSTLFSIVRQVHTQCISTHLDNLEEMMTTLRDNITLHSVEKPPTSIDIYSPEEARALFEYMLDTYFRHYKMYKYAFTPKYTMNFVLRYDDEPEEAPEEVGQTKDDKPDISGEVEVDGAEVQPQPVAAEDDQQPITSDLPDRNAAEAELRSVISRILQDRMKKLEGNVDIQMKALETRIMQQVTLLAGGGGKKGAK